MAWRAGLAFLAISALPALADCPPVPDTSDLRAALHSQLLNAQTEAEATAIAGRIWQIWLTAPDAKAQALLDRAMALREGWDLETSESVLDQLTAYCPDYTEGYNQRAFIRFLRQDYDGALEDIELVLQADPLHFGALSGKALALMQQGRARLALEALREAVGVHPFLQERRMLADPAREL